MLALILSSFLAVFHVPNTSKLDTALANKGFILSPSGNNNEGYLTKRQKAQYSHLIKDNPWIQDICEIGLNGGHSAYNFMLSVKKLKSFVSFDINMHPYTQVAADFLKGEFGNTFEIFFGDSKEAVPAFTLAFPNRKFDLLYVDGDHTTEGCYLDILNFRPLARKRHLLIVDDFYDERVGRAIQQCLDQGLITVKDVIRSNTPGEGHRSFIIATYN